MKLTLLAVGRKMPAWINSGFETYARRISDEWTLRLIEVAALKRSGADSPETLRAREAGLIREKIPPGSYLVALDENGKSCTTRDLSRKLQKWQDNATDICFLIGGADGLDRALIDEAFEVLSLSTMTLPHGLARVMLAEQLYRAWSILKHHPYHRD